MRRTKFWKIRLSIKLGNPTLKKKLILEKQKYFCQNDHNFFQEVFSTRRN